jgi:tRNA threonylcarbamoyladenosine biosynthesis protein TsaB
MKILAIDTAGQTASVAIVNDYITIGEFTVNVPSKHSKVLLPMLDQLFKQTGLEPAEMDWFACVNGPGSFTGLRIGMAAAMGLAKGSGKKLVAVPTLDALAYNMLTMVHEDTIVYPMLDARRNQVYTASYIIKNGEINRISAYAALPVIETLPALTGQKAIFLGDGASAYENIINEHFPAAVFAPVNANRSRAASVGLCALNMINRGYAPQTNIEMLYIRKPQAERERESKC